MKLEQIRKISTEADLIKAAYYLSDNMAVMAFGDFAAIKNTIEHTAKRLGVSLERLNEIVTNYQIFGEYKNEP